MAAADLGGVQLDGVALHDVDERRVEHVSQLLPGVGQHRPDRSLLTRLPQLGVYEVGKADDPGTDRYGAPGQPVRETLAIEALVVVPDHLPRLAQLLHHVDRGLSAHRMKLVQVDLLLRHADRLLFQNGRRDADDADVVQQRRRPYRLDLRGFQAEFSGAGDRERRHVPRVALQLGAVQLDQPREGEDGVIEGVPDALVSSPQFLVLAPYRRRLLQNPPFKAAVPFAQLKVLLLDQCGEGPVFLDQAVLLQPLLDRALQCLVVPRFRQVAPRPPLVDGVHGGCHVRVAGQHHPHRVGHQLARLSQELGAAHPGHALVRQDERHIRVRREYLQPLVAGVGRQHLQFQLLFHEQPGDRAYDVILVIDQENLVRRKV